MPAAPKRARRSGYAGRNCRDKACLVPTAPLLSLTQILHRLAQRARGGFCYIVALRALPQRYLLYTWTGGAAPAQVLPPAKMYENYIKKAWRGSAPNAYCIKLTHTQPPYAQKNPIYPLFSLCGIFIASTRPKSPRKRHG